jgi:hypothetical protein
MLRKALSTVTVLALLAATAVTAHAQLRTQLRMTPQIRVTPSPITTYFNPKEITIDKPVPWQARKPKEIVVVGSGAKQSGRANDRLRNAGPPDDWSR